MLDQLSKGRFDLGVGRGISPIETAYYGVDPEHRQKMYLEALQILRQALTSRQLTFRDARCFWWMTSWTKAIRSRRSMRGCANRAHYAL